MKTTPSSKSALRKNSAAQHNGGREVNWGVWQRHNTKLWYFCTYIYSRWAMLLLRLKRLLMLLPLLQHDMMSNMETEPSASSSGHSCTTSTRLTVKLLTCLTFCIFIIFPPSYPNSCLRQCFAHLCFSDHTIDPSTWECNDFLRTLYYLFIVHRDQSSTSNCRKMMLTTCSSTTQHICPSKLIVLIKIIAENPVMLPIPVNL